MTIKGNIFKMRTELSDAILYYLPIGDKEIKMNPYIGKKISLTFSKQINCIKCGSVTKKSFAQGFCYPCFASAPETEECVLKPELCQAQEGIARDMEWAEGHCLQDHYVYLAVSSAVKVGVTRATQIPTRWIDQGASAAIKLAKTPNRYLAGTIEVALKEYLTDKTNWRKMLKNEIIEADLVDEKYQMLELLPNDMQEFASEDDTVTELPFPVLEFPTKVTSVSFDKKEIIEGTLVGIKGQYLIFSDNTVLNIRKHNGYMLEFNG